MGTAYQICCKHCGTRFNHSADAGFGFLPMCVGCGDMGGYIETETSIRCPSCHRRLNNTPEEFIEQVEMTYTWDYIKPPRARS